MRFYYQLLLKESIMQFKIIFEERKVKPLIHQFVNRCRNGYHIWNRSHFRCLCSLPFIRYTQLRVVALKRTRTPSFHSMREPRIVRFHSYITDFLLGARTTDGAWLRYIAGTNFEAVVPCARRFTTKDRRRYELKGGHDLTPRPTRINSNHE